MPAPVLHRLKQLAPELEMHAMASDLPVWRAISTRDIARHLGVSIQVLANWRVRGIGPPSHPAPKGAGNKRFYKLHEVLTWLSGRDPLALCRDWVIARGLTDADCSEEEIKWLVSILP